MNAIIRMLGQSRLIMTAATLLAAVGLFAWLTMPRQEDPDMTVRWALVSVEFPGADAEKVESLIIEPLEEHLAVERDPLPAQLSVPIRLAKAAGKVLVSLSQP